ncbi:MAG: zinc ribbon domain-containing protein [Nitrospirota bacterium]
MPIYEYTCNKCSNDFEKLVFSTTAAVCCPNCSSDNVVKKISLFGMGGGSKSDSSSDSSSSCSSCTSNNCSNCH